MIDAAIAKINVGQNRAPEFSRRVKDNLQPSTLAKVWISTLNSKTG